MKSVQITIESPDPSLSDNLVFFLKNTIIPSNYVLNVSAIAANQFARFPDRPHFAHMPVNGIVVHYQFSEILVQSKVNELTELESIAQMYSKILLQVLQKQDNYLSYLSPTDVKFIKDCQAYTDNLALQMNEERSRMMEIDLRAFIANPQANLMNSQSAPFQFFATEQPKAEKATTSALVYGGLALLIGIAGISALCTGQIILGLILAGLSGILIKATYDNLEITTLSPN
ncbi:MAG: hypothetical protein EPN84_04330 [Legionella sp.]|nr:MAG: hypothetical protein EPN84_04330 [Legionella sp.]